MILKNINNIILANSRRNFSLSCSNLARKPPKAEYENNIFHTRKRTSEPFDRRWKWNAKSAEPFNVRGGHKDWTLMPFLHRGVQMPGYLDPKTKKFIHVDEMVPEIIVPDLNGFELKPYVTYAIGEVKTNVFDAKTLYEKTLEKDVIREFKATVEKPKE